MSSSNCRYSIFAFLFISAPLAAQEEKVLRSQLKDQTAVSLTVYANGRSMIRDRRKINFEKGQMTLELQDVSAQMRSETAQFRNISSPGDINVLEQNLEFDLLSPQKLLEKYLGKSVSVIRSHPTNGSDTSEPAEVLSVQDGVVLKMKGRIETGMPGRISFSELPANLRSQPTLSLLVDSKKRGEQEVELNYLSDGLTWRADYIADLNSEENKINLTGLVTLTNESGTTFKNAQLQLMGGDIQTVEGGPRRLKKAQQNVMAFAVTPEADTASSRMQSEAFFEYHLYSLPRQTSILSNQTKQVVLLQAADVISRKEIVFAGGNSFPYGEEYDSEVGQDQGTSSSVDDAELGTPIAGSVYLAFENDQKSRMGMPLPAGTVRVYKRDKLAASQFIGEDNIKHTAENERVRVRLGSSFDVTARRKKLSFKNIPAPANLRKTIRVVEYSNRVTLSNAKASEQNVIYRESIPGEGKIQQSSREYSLLGKGNVEWKLTIPAKGKISLDYTVRANLRN